MGDLVFDDLTLQSDTYELHTRNSVRLSPVEFELLRTFILNPGRVLSASYLLERAWQGDDEADEVTVALYVRYLRGKLEAVGSRVQIVDAGDGWIIAGGGAE